MFRQTRWISTGTKSLRALETFGDFSKGSQDLMDHTNVTADAYDTKQLLDKVMGKDANMDLFYRNLRTQTQHIKPMATLEEQKSFNRIFDYLKKDRGEIGITDTMKKIASLNGMEEQQGPTSTMAEEYTKRAKRERKLRISLLPTLNYINKQIVDTEQMAQFVRSNVLGTFLEWPERALNAERLNSHTTNQIAKASETNPAQPLMDKETLPLLVKFCLGSLIRDFDAMDEALLLVDEIRTAENLELYEFAMNVDVYNMLLEEVWQRTENLHSITSLLDEMKFGAVSPDLLTYQILSRIYLKCMSANSSQLAQPYILWGDSADIHKIRHLLEKLSSHL